MCMTLMRSEWCLLCQSVSASGDGAAAARVDAVSRTDHRKATSDAGRFTSVVCFASCDCNVDCAW